MPDLDFLLSPDFRSMLRETSQASFGAICWLHNTELTREQTDALNDLADTLVLRRLATLGRLSHRAEQIAEAAERTVSAAYNTAQMLEKHNQPKLRGTAGIAL